MGLLALVMSCAALCAAEPQSPAPVASDSPVSIDRILEQLQRPTVIRMPREPDFRVAVQEEFQLRQTALDMLRQELGSDVLRSLPAPLIGNAQTLLAIDVIQLGMTLKAKLAAARRARGERNARREVAAALAEFCASHDCSVLESAPEVPKPEGILTH